MPRVNYVQKARKDNPAVKKGEPYYWWQFAYSSKSYSRTRPRASQLTRSEFLSEMYSIIEEVEDMSQEDLGGEGADDLINDLVSRVEALRDAADESFNNMPEGLQMGPTGELLKARVAACEQMGDDLEAAKDGNDGEEKLTLLQGVSYDGE